MSDGYNGWMNYETWNWNLWLMNDEGTYRQWTERAEELYRDAIRDDTKSNRNEWTKTAVNTLRAELESECDSMQESAGLPESGPFTDIIKAALSEINWHEIATSYVENVDMDEIEQEEREPIEVEDDETA